MPRKWVYDYYRVKVLDDVFDNPKDRGELAIDQACENARLHCIPCTWYVVADDGQVVTVCRKRDAIAKQSHYHVYGGLAGLYLPSINSVCRTRREAHALLMQLVGESRGNGDHVARLGRDDYGIGRNVFGEYIEHLYVERCSGNYCEIDE